VRDITGAINVAVCRSRLGALLGHRANLSTTPERSRSSTV
jgi:hypothetical protein